MSLSTVLVLALVETLLFLALSHGSADAATTFTVNRTGDAVDRRLGDDACDASRERGRQCTLRAAIQEANDTPGPDRIGFNILGIAAVKTVAPARPLPAITEAVTIDGYTQRGARANSLAEGTNAVLKIQLSGANAGDGAAGITVTGADNIVRGLVINRFRGGGVVLEGAGATNNEVQGNFIGTDASGTRPMGNNDASTFPGYGVQIRGGSGNLVGGTGAGARNLISANSYGVSISGTGATDNRIEGNLMGTNAAGTRMVGNAYGGVVIEDVPGNIVGGTASGAGNVISGSLDYNVFVTGATATGNRVQGNRIGTDLTGTQDLLFSMSGVAIDAPGNLVGGTGAGAVNLISGNVVGVSITGAGTNNRIEGNRIGTDVTGTQKLPNAGSGVEIGGAGNFVGGTQAGAGNLISGNSEHGVLIRGTGATNNSVEGNLVGTDASGNQGLGNGLYGVSLGSGLVAMSPSASDNTVGKGNTIAHNPSGGVRIIGSRNRVEGSVIEANGGNGVNISYYSFWDSSGNHRVIPSNDNLIGGASGAQENVIRDNNGSGVRISGGAGNSVRTNRIFANGYLGILYGFMGGVGFNDEDDPDGGDNNGQNYPVVTSATKDPVSGETTITGTLNSNPNQTYLIQCFEADSDARNHGEGETFLGEATAATDADGDATFTCTATEDALAVGDEVTTTATNTSGTAANTRIGDTSQFSQNVAVTAGQ
ncbi:MAG: Aldehyde dehydrogenase [uncultured Rubrobacteraceae bacterium]|uniref:Aldehyde dehydrogenase n=1 Tax=uncultured Rubrobacteraceae bacterium TaxID=349277 RepID=A0A6J4NUF3_9ACTN|nr:MAG: Aldehyde dehydrogenase [uncultured Rubrobacteraceae bacterium]